MLHVKMLSLLCSRSKYCASHGSVLCANVKVFDYVIECSKMWLPFTDFFAHTLKRPATENAKAINALCKQLRRSYANNTAFEFFCGVVFPKFYLTLFMRSQHDGVGRHAKLKLDNMHFKGSWDLCRFGSLENGLWFTLDLQKSEIPQFQPYY